MNKLLRLLLIIYVCIFMPALLFAQSDLMIFDDDYLIVREYDNTNILPAIGVASVIQDSHGFIWAATYNGLMKYDGKNSKIYNTSTVKGLQSNRFVQVAEDSTGAIWAALEFNILMRISSDGLSFFDLRDSETADNINTLTLSVSPENDIWVGTNVGVFIIRNELTSFKEVLKSESTRIIKHYLDETYILTANRLLKYTRNEGFQNIIYLDEDKWFRTENYRLSKKIEDRLFREAFTIVDGELYIIYYDKLLKLGEDSYEIIIDGLSPNPKNNLKFVHNHWFIYGANGLVIYNNEHLDREPYSFGEDKMITGFTYDREGSLWLSSPSSGLFQIIQTPVYQGNLYDRVGELSITGIHKTKDDIIFTGTGCNGFFRITETETIMLPEVEAPYRRCVWPIIESSQEDIIIGTWGQGGFRYDDRKQSFSELKADNQIIPDVILALHELENNEGLLLGTFSEGLFLLHDNMLESIKDSRGRTLARIRDIYPDSRGRLWIVTESGIGLYENGVVNLKESFNVITNNFRKIIEDKHGRLWIGTEGAGLLIVLNDGRALPLTPENGLYDETVSQIAFDQNDNLWLGGNKGIYFIQSDQLDQYIKGETNQVNITQFGLKEGLSTTETNGGFTASQFMDENGFLYIPMVNGITKINTTKYTPTNTPPIVVIDEITLNNELLTNHPGTKLPYNIRNLLIKFSVLSFKSPDFIRVEYFLEDFHDEWQTAPESREILFPTLPTGIYTLRIRAQNNEGIWNEEDASFSFTVEAPFWQTIYFQALIFFILLGIVILSIHIYGRYKANQQARIEKLKSHERELIRKKLAADFHDEIGTKITRIGLLINRMEQTKELQPDILKKMKNNTNQLYSETRDFIWQMDPGKDTFYDVYSWLLKFGYDFYEDSPIEFEGNTAPADLKMVSFSMKAKTDILRSFKEAMNNAQKYSKAQRVLLSVKKKYNLITLSLSDDGIGMDLTVACKKGNGLKNMQSRLESAGGSFHITSEPGKGTTISFTYQL